MAATKSSRDSPPGDAVNTFTRRQKGDKLVNVGNNRGRGFDVLVVAERAGFGATFSFRVVGTPDLLV